MISSKKYTKGISALLVSTSLLALAGCMGSTSEPQLSADKYNQVKVDQKNQLAYDMTDAKNDTLKSLDLKKIDKHVSAKKNKIYKNLIKPLGIVHTRYGYYSDVLPLYEFYAKGAYPKALTFNSYLQSGNIAKYQGDETALVGALGYRGQEETSQMLLDNGYVDSVVKVSEPLRANLTSDNGHEKFEDIQVINNLIIAQALAGSTNYTNNARLVSKFQSTELQKYRKELEQAKKDAQKEEAKDAKQDKGINTAGITSKLTKKFKGANYRKTAKLAKEVTSPYVNSTADFLVAYAEESGYIAGMNRGEHPSWSNVFISMKHVCANSVSLKHFGGDEDKCSKQNFGVEADKKIDLDTNKVVYALIATDIAPSKGIVYAKLDVPVPSSLGIGPMLHAGFSNIELIPAKNTIHSVALNKNKLYKIASPEAYISKYYIDHYNINMGLQVAKTITTTVVATIAQKKAAAYGGSLLGGVAGTATGAAGDLLSIPRPEGWQTMPANIYATRLEVPKDTQSVTLTVNGKKQVITLSDSPISLVYARATGNKFNATVSKPVNLKKI